MPSIKARLEALERRDGQQTRWRMPLVIHVDPEWSAERRDQAIQAAHERADRPWPMPWQPGDPPRMVLIHMHLGDEEDSIELS
jgi:hypothetical protein